MKLDEAEAAGLVTTPVDPDILEQEAMSMACAERRFSEGEDIPGWTEKKVNIISDFDCGICQICR